MRTILLSRQTGRPVSSVLEIEDGYTAFCIDEAAEYVTAKLKSGKRPIRRGSNQEIAAFLSR